MAKKAHFTPGLFTFLSELRLHNDREWFERNIDRSRRRHLPVPRASTPSASTLIGADWTSARRLPRPMARWQVEES